MRNSDDNKNKKEGGPDKLDMRCMRCWKVCRMDKPCEEGVEIIKIMIYERSEKWQ